MRFIINKIEYESNLIIVTGNTSIGSLKGIWIYAQPTDRVDIKKGNCVKYLFTQFPFLYCIWKYFYIMIICIFGF
mgnify:CR=1 FL=1